MPDDVVTVLVLMLREELLTNSNMHKWRAVVTLPLAVVIWKSRYAVDQVPCMMEDVIFGYKNTELIFMLIVLHGHYHLVVLDIAGRTNMHYSSLQSPTYDADSIKMVS